MHLTVCDYVLTKNYKHCNTYLFPKVKPPNSLEATILLRKKVFIWCLESSNQKIQQFQCARHYTSELSYNNSHTEFFQQLHEVGFINIHFFIRLFISFIILPVMKLMPERLGVLPGVNVTAQQVGGAVIRPSCLCLSPEISGLNCRQGGFSVLSSELYRVPMLPRARERNS